MSTLLKQKSTNVIKGTYHLPKIYSPKGAPWITLRPKTAAKMFSSSLTATGLPLTDWAKFSELGKKSSNIKWLRWSCLLRNSSLIIYSPCLLIHVHNKAKAMFHTEADPQLCWNRTWIYINCLQCLCPSMCLHLWISFSSAVLCFRSNTYPQLILEVEVALERTWGFASYFIRYVSWSETPWNVKKELWPWCFCQRSVAMIVFSSSTSSMSDHFAFLEKI